MIGRPWATPAALHCWPWGGRRCCSCMLNSAHALGNDAVSSRSVSRTKKGVRGFSALQLLVAWVFVGCRCCRRLLPGFKTHAPGAENPDAPARGGRCERVGQAHGNAPNHRGGDQNTLRSIPCSVSSTPPISNHMMSCALPACKKRTVYHTLTADT